MVTTEYTITININPKSAMSTKEFILTTLNGVAPRSIQVSELMRECNRYRAGLKKKLVRYTSFRTIISDLARDEYIECTTKERETPFDPSFYKITEDGRRRLLFLTSR